MSKYHGKSSSITFDGTAQAMRTWRWNPDTDMAEATDARNASSPASDGSVWDEFLSGFSKSDLEVECMYDDAIALPSVGAAVAFVGNLGGGHGVSFSAYYKGPQMGANIKDSTKVTHRFQQSGNPTFF